MTKQVLGRCNETIIIDHSTWLSHFSITQILCYNAKDSVFWWTHYLVPGELSLHLHVQDDKFFGRHAVNALTTCRIAFYVATCRYRRFVSGKYPLKHQKKTVESSIPSCLRLTVYSGIPLTHEGCQYCKTKGWIGNDFLLQQETTITNKHYMHKS